MEKQEVIETLMEFRQASQREAEYLQTDGSHAARFATLYRSCAKSLVVKLMREMLGRDPKLEDVDNVLR